MKKYLLSFCVLNLFLMMVISVCFAQISMSVGGSNHSVIAGPGGVCGWGVNGNGQIGDNTIVNKTAPVGINVTNIGTRVITKVVAGQHITIFLANDNTVWGCGYNEVGQLGRGDWTQQIIPVQIGAGFTWTDIACGTNLDHILLLKSDGTVWSAGRKHRGQLGVADNFPTGPSTGCWNPPSCCCSCNGGSNDCEWSLLQVVSTSGAGTLSSIGKIYAGSYQSFAVHTNGTTVYAWGDNSGGQLGDGTITTRNYPVAITVPGAGTVTKISVGALHTLFLRSDGTVYACGTGRWSFQCGAAPRPNGNLAIANLVNAGAALTVGSEYVITTYVAGDVFTNVGGTNANCSWFNATGTTPTTWSNGSSVATIIALTPKQCTALPGASTWSDIAAGGAYSLFLRNDGSVWASGENTYGALGNGAGFPTSFVTTPAMNAAPLNSGITMIRAGTHTQGISLFYNGTTKTFYSAGYNVNGQLGDGTTTGGPNNGKSVPVTVSSGAGCLPSILPVELLSFNATCLSGLVKCQWSTASEINNDYFTIEQSTDGINWKEIGTMPGAGNSSSVRNYEFIDESAVSQISNLSGGSPSDKSQIYFRLKQTDYDGRYEYFGPISVACSPSGEWNLMLQNIFYGDELKGTLFVTEDAEITISVMDIQGRTIKQETTNAMKGSNLLKIELGEIDGGIYFVKVSGIASTIVRKFVKR